MNSKTMHPMSPNRFDWSEVGYVSDQFRRRIHRPKVVSRFAKPFAVRAGKTGHPMSPNRGDGGIMFTLILRGQ